MGSLLGGSKKQTTTSSFDQQQRVQIPDFLKDVIPSLVERAEDVSLTPYEPYGGQRIEGFTPDQLAAFEGVRGLQGQYQPAIDEALGLNRLVAQRAAEGFSPEDTQKYMSPYTQNVIDIEKREALRDFDIGMEGIGDIAAQAGAFGGDRQGVLEAEAMRGVRQQLSDIESRGLQSAYDRALSTAVAQEQMLGQAAAQQAGLAGQAQGQLFRDLAGLQEIGGQQQALGQAGLDFDYSQFLEGRQWPYQNLQFLSGIALPTLQLTAGQNTSGTSQSTTKQSESVSPISAALGLATAASGVPGLGSAMGGGLASMGSALGGAMGGGGLGGAMFGAGHGLAGLGYSRSPLQLATAGMGGAYGPGFKEGGLVKYSGGGSVKKYAGGDLVEGEPPLRVTPEMATRMLEMATPEELPKVQHILKQLQGSTQVQPKGGLMNFLKDTGRVMGDIGTDAGRIIRDSAIVGKDALFGDYMEDRANAQKAKDIIKQSKALQKEINKLSPEQKTGFERDLANIGDSLKSIPDSFTEKALRQIAGIDKLRSYFTDPEGEEQLSSGIAEALKSYEATPPVPTKKPASAGSETFGPEKKKPVTVEQALVKRLGQLASAPQQGASKEQGPNLALLKAAGRILASPGESPVEALGHGLGAYVDAKTVSNATELKQKQNAFENMMREKNMNINQQNMLLNAQKQALAEAMQPWQMKKEQAEAALAQSKLRAQGTVAGLAEQAVLKAIESGSPLTNPEEVVNMIKQARQMGGNIDKAEFVLKLRQQGYSEEEIKKLLSSQ